ncbi:MAG: hypothetical protein WBM02_07865 [bacterium]
MNQPKIKKSVRKSLFILLSLVFLNSFSGCEDDIVTSDLTITWAMDNLSPGTNCVFLAQVISEPNELKLAVDLNSITNGLTHGVFFDLVFRDEVFTYSGFSEGAVLETAGPVVYQVALDPQDSGRLVVGVTLLESAAVENAKGILLTFRFTALRSGSSSFSFENAKIMTPENGGTLPVTGVSWYGGYATVIQ